MCKLCKGTGSVMQERDLHRSAGLIPCPNGCKAFYEIIEDALEDKVVTRDELCKTFGISKRTLRRWASGENAPHEKLIPVVENYIKDLRVIAEEDYGR